MADQHRNAFGRLVVDPRQLDREKRVDALRRVAGALQASEALDEVWLGRGLSAWLNGAELDDALGVEPPPRSRETVQRLVRRDRADELLLAFAAALGSDAQASRILRGAPCPAEHAELLAELRAIDAPRSIDSIQRARKRRM